MGKSTPETGASSGMALSDLGKVGTGPGGGSQSGGGSIKEQLKSGGGSSSIVVHNNLNHSHHSHHKYHSHQIKHQQQPPSNNNSMTDNNNSAVASTSSPPGAGGSSGKNACPSPSSNNFVDGLQFVPPAYNSNARVNVVEALQEFWSSKFTKDGPESSASADACLIYESVPSQTAPYTCYVTLPGGSCFGTFQKCMTKADARRSAAKLALMNSLYNEVPTRIITDPFISQTLQEAKQSASATGTEGEDAEEGISVYKQLLDICKGKSMLQFQEMMTVFQLLHWNGSLRAMRERNCTRPEVIEHYCNRKIDDTMRRQMSLDWVAREQIQTGTILRELAQAEVELDECRNMGRELRFPKEKRDILILAQNQLISGL